MGDDGTPAAGSPDPNPHFRAGAPGCTGGTWGGPLPLEEAQIWGGGWPCGLPAPSSPSSPCLPPPPCSSLCMGGELPLSPSLLKTKEPAPVGRSLSQDPSLPALHPNPGPDLCAQELGWTPCLSPSPSKTPAAQALRSWGAPAAPLPHTTLGGLSLGSREPFITHMYPTSPGLGGRQESHSGEGSAGRPLGPRSCPSGPQFPFHMKRTDAASPPRWRSLRWGIKRAPKHEK